MEGILEKVFAAVTDPLNLSVFWLVIIGLSLYFQGKSLMKLVDMWKNAYYKYLHLYLDSQEEYSRLLNENRELQERIDNLLREVRKHDPERGH